MNEGMVQKKEAQATSKTKTKKGSPFFGGVVLQRKLSIGSADDAYEKEADQVADKVVQMKPAEMGSPPQIGALIQRQCADCEEESIQQKGAGSEGGTASQALTQQINNTRGNGHKMDSSTLDFMENRFGSDFSNVSIHTGSNAIQMNRELNAHAFTVGNDIYFNQGKYNPGSESGKHLLAHELTHTIQQGHGKNLRRSMVSPTQANGGTVSEEEIQMKSAGLQIQRMQPRNQSGGADHIAGNVAPWKKQGFTDPRGDKHWAYTDAGTGVVAWTAINYSSDDLRFWCHGHTLRTYRNWFYSVYSGSEMQKAVNDEYNAVAEADVRSGDIAVWTPSYGHSCIIEDPTHNGNALDDASTTVSTKNGREALKNATLSATKHKYRSLRGSVGYYRHK
ncbi:MAG: DUF4157 domain-containing protein [Flavobacteriaceae bacterium]|nr:DUF4157 domain-containing protein [Flavobacteriaceae bacterium]